MTQKAILFSVAAGAFIVATVPFTTSGTAATILAALTCTSTSPCSSATNTGTGPAFLGSSSKGHGVIGYTRFASTNGTNGESAVFGQDLSTTGTFDMGVQGFSIRGYGVRGKSTSNIGMRGDSATSIGVEGTSTNGVAVAGVSTNNIGVQGQGSNYIGVYGTGSEGVYGTGTTYGTIGIGSSVGMYATGSTYGLYSTGGTNGIGLIGTSSAGQGIYVASNTNRAIEGHTSQAQLGMLVTNGNGSGGEIDGSYAAIIGRSNTFPLVLINSSGQNLLYVDGAGNLYYKGSLIHFGPAAPASAQTTAQQANGAQTEQTGTARLTFGQATVYLSPSLARSIDVRQGYQVLLTPGGDTRGLYVASKFQNGFVVREIQGGRGTLNFDYHVYATASAATPEGARGPAPAIRPAQSTVLTPLPAPKAPAALERP